MRRIRSTGAARQSPIITVVGIDPGLTGAISQINLRGELLQSADITAVEGRIDAFEVVANLDLMNYRPYRIGMVVMESVHSMPRQGVASTFKFGRATGTLEGIVQAMNLPMDWITPAQWKAKIGLPKDDKDGSRQWARRRWPVRAEQPLFFKPKLKGQARADAAGIAVAWLEKHPEFRP